MEAKREPVSIQELEQKGIIKTKNGKMLNAVAECYSTGGCKGYWIDGKFWKMVLGKLIPPAK